MSINLTGNAINYGAVVGTPGTLPTGWSLGGDGAGLVVSVVGFGIDPVLGLPYVDIRWNGTATGAGNTATLAFDTTTCGVLQYTLSSYVALTAGSLTNIGGVLTQWNAQASFSYLSSIGGVAFTPNATLTRHQATATNPATTNQAYTYIQLQYTAATAINCTLRIAGVQFEQAAVAGVFAPSPGYGDIAVTTEILTPHADAPVTLTSDSAAAAGDSLTLLTFSISLGDTLASSDSLALTAASLTVPVSTASSSDSYTVGAGIYTSTISDTVVISDAFSPLAGTVNPWSSDWSSDFGTGAPVVTGYTATLIDSVATSDSISVALQDIISTSDSPFSIDFSIDFGSGGTPELYSGALSAPITLTDAIATSDAVTFSAVSLAISDSAATSDALTVPAASLSLADSAVTSESLSGIGTAAATVIEGAVTAADSLTATGAALSLNDVAATGDSTSGTGTGAFTLTDSAASSETLLRTAIALVLTDSLATGESLTFIAGYVISQADSVAIADGLSVATGAYTGALSETAVTTDAATAAAAVTTAFSDSTATGDSVLFAGLNLSRADSIASADTVSATGIGASAIGDSAATGDAIGFLRGYVATDSETAAATETLTPGAVAVSTTLTDTVTVTKTLTPAMAIQPVSLGDSAGASDFFHTVTYLNVLADSSAATDALGGIAAAAGVLADTVVTSDLAAALTLFDSTAAADTLAGTGASFAAFLDAALSGDILLPFKGYQSALADTLTSGDGTALQNYGYGFAPADTVAVSEFWASLGISSPLTVIATVVPTGGAVLLQFPGYFPVLPNATELTISRSVVGSGHWTVIYQGPPAGAFLDVGDGTPKPLDPHIAYLWQAADYSGTTLVGPLTPAASFISAPDQLTQILIRALQGAINSMPRPHGIPKPMVTTRMPTNGWQAMPFIVVNLDLIQQTEVEVGEGVENPMADNTWVLFANAKRIWRVTIMSQDAEERDFYRDALLAVFRVLKATAFGPIGLDVSHTFQAVSYSNVHEYDGVAPGFYAADLLLEINGIFPAVVLTNYPVIQQIESDPTWLLNTFTEELRT